MTLARALPGSFCLFLFLFLGCGSPPPDPSRAAVTVTVTSNGSGSACIPTTSLLEIPGGVSTGAVQRNLTCDTSQASCQPNALLAEDGKDGVAISCSVKGGGGAFTVQLNADAPGIFTFNAQGTINGTAGGDFHVGVINRKTTFPGAGEMCAVTVTSIDPGFVLAKYDCPGFDTPNIGQSPGCHAFGQFLFDRCDH